MVSLLNNSNHVIQACCSAGPDPEEDDPVVVDKGDRPAAERAALPGEHLTGRTGRDEHLRSR